MADMMELKNMLRKGTVQKVDRGKMRARVKFGDKGGINSGELHILSRAGQGGSEAWAPHIGDMALCLMVPDGDGEGYILGVIE